MKQNYTATVKAVLQDRYVASLLAVFLVLVLAMSVQIGLLMRPTELQLVVHYSAFGETYFYRDKWYYLFNFIACGVVIGAAHTLITAKLMAYQRRSLAVSFAWMSIGLVVVCWLLIYALMGIALLT